jgi:hypothetical protein
MGVGRSVVEKGSMPLEFRLVDMIEMGETRG